MQLTLRIDEILVARHTDVLSLHLEGAVYDTWKGLLAAGKEDVEIIKAVFGLQRMDVWMLVVSLGSLTLGKTVDVAFEEMKKLIGIAAEGDNAIGCLAACLLTMRLPVHVCEQVLLQCGTDLYPTEVVACTKQLMVAYSPPAHGLSMAAGARDISNAMAVAPNCGARQGQSKSGQSSRQRGQSISKCFRCQLPGHFACNCTAKLPVPPAHSAVSGNAGVGQPLE